MHLQLGILDIAHDKVLSLGRELLEDLLSRIGERLVVLALLRFGLRRVQLRVALQVLADQPVLGFLRRRQHQVKVLVQAI